MRSTHNSPCLGGVCRVVGCILLGAGATDSAFHSSPSPGLGSSPSQKSMTPFAEMCGGD